MGAERWLCSSCGAASDPAPETPPGCARCAAPLHVGKFGLIEMLAMRVYRGRESAGTRTVTIRLLPDELSSSLPDLRQALKKIGSFTHPAIATPVDVGIHRNRVYIAEEFVAGVGITRADPTLREAMTLMRDVALALEAAHEQGIVHPDFRAENLRVFRAPSRGLEESGWRVSITGYIGPGESSVRANLKALGSILFTVAMGRPPGPENSGPLNPLVDTALEAIIRMAMETESSHQHPGAGAIAAELTRWLKGDSPSVRPATVIIPPPKKLPITWSRIRLEARVAGGVVLVLIALILFLALRSPSPSGASEGKPEPTPEPKVAEAKPAPEPPPRKIEEPKPPPPVEPPKPPPKVEEPKPAPVEPPKPPPKVEEPKPVPVEPPKPPPKPPPPPPKPSSAAALGSVHGVHPDYGVFVKLEIATAPATGEELEAVRDGQVVARLAVNQVTAADKRYPMGCAVCKIVSGTPAAGDAIRRIAK